MNISSFTFPLVHKSWYLLDNLHIFPPLIMRNDWHRTRKHKRSLWYWGATSPAKMMMMIMIIYFLLVAEDPYTCRWTPPIIIAKAWMKMKQKGMMTAISKYLETQWVDNKDPGTYGWSWTWRTPRAHGANGPYLCEHVCQMQNHFSKGKWRYWKWPPTH